MDGLPASVRNIEPERVDKPTVGPPHGFNRGFHEHGSHVGIRKEVSGEPIDDRLVLR